MTVSTQISREDYNGNGVTTVFPYRFRIFNETSLEVVRTDPNGVETRLVLNSDYTVTGVRSYSGGNVILNIAPPINFSLAIVRKLPTVQETDIRNQGNFFPEVHEDVFDYLTMLIQQNDEALTRALLKPVGGNHYYDAKGQRIINLGDPLLPQDAVTKKWVDLQYSVPTEEAKQAAREAKEARDETRVIANKFGDVDHAIDVAQGAAASAKQSETNSAINADRAEAAASSAMLEAETFDSVAAGLAGTTSGQYFRVWQASSTGISFIFYKNNGGAAQELTDYPSGSALDFISFGQAGDGIAITDPQGRPSFSTVDGNIFAGNLDVVQLPGDGVFWIDPDGYAIELQLKNDDQESAAWITEQTEKSEVLARQSREAVASRGNNAIRPLAQIVHDIYYGQSLQNGTEGWPRLSTVQPLDNLMFGDSVMPASPTAAVFTPRGGAVLKPLIATCCDANGNALTDSQVAALAPGTIAYGESPVEGALNSWRRHHLDRLGISSEPNRLFVGSATGVGGRTIAQLSKGASPELYNRFYTAMTGVKAIADATGKSYQVGCIVHMHGQQDYPSATKEYFKTATLQLRDDMYTDVASVTGQSRMPAFIIDQAGASFTRDEHDMAVGMAQIELADENENIFLAGPTYPYTDKNGHLDSNGYRWFAEKLGEISFRVCELGHDWKPLQPIAAVCRGVDVLLSMHTPAPPLRFAAPYVVNAAQEYADKGFTAIDRFNGSDTPISILSVEIRGLSTIHITLTREPRGALLIRYADKANHNGNGMVCDSSNGLSESKYVYLPGSGMYPSANIPELVNKYYDLRNWSVAYQITAEEV